MSTESSPTGDTADGELVTHEEAHVLPEDVTDIGGGQTVDDKIETLLRQIEAAENLGDSDLWADVIWYGAVLLAFIIGSFLSGFSVDSGGGGGFDPVPIGLVDVSPVVDVLLSGAVA